MTIHTIKEPSNLTGLHICVFFKVDLLDLKYRHFAFHKGSGIIHRSSNARHFRGCHQHAMNYPSHELAKVLARVHQRQPNACFDPARKQQLEIVGTPHPKSGVTVS